MSPESWQMRWMCAPLGRELDVKGYVTSVCCDEALILVVVVVVVDGVVVVVVGVERAATGKAC